MVKKEVALAIGGSIETFTSAIETEWGFDDNDRRTAVIWCGGASVPAPLGVLPYTPQRGRSWARSGPVAQRRARLPHRQRRACRGAFRARTCAESCRSMT
jgi:hypothetical protein